MRYRLSMPEPHSHLFHVEAEVAEPGTAVEWVFPVWTPGSYLVREYARHVEGFAAEDGTGRTLPVERLDKHRFRVASGGAGRVVVRYRVYANELTVRTAHLDGTHGYVNGAPVFSFVRGREGEPHHLHVDAPAGWRVSTALDGGPADFTARDYDELVDSPIEIGTHQVVPFTAAGKPHELAIWGRGDVDAPRLAEDARKIVEAHAALMGGLPYDRYLFIVHLTGKGRGGLEHGRSTTLLVARSAFFPKDAYEETLGLFSHEFFHVWNVKRLRPAAFVPFDYGRENYTRLLWWFEGATSYYENLVLVRAGLLSPARWLEQLGKGFTVLERSPGARKVSVEEASLLAWVKLYRPDENSANSAISYYLKGELVALALDLALRRAGHSLDALLHALVARYAAGGLPENGVEHAAAELLGADAARAFFDAYVRGTARLEPDLASVGVALRRRAATGADDKGGKPAKPEPDAPRAGFLGAELSSGPKLTVTSVREGGPAWRAGLYAEDEIVAEGGFRVDRAGIATRCQAAGPGGTLRLTVFRRDELVEVPVVLGDPPEDTVWLEVRKDAPSEARAAFQAWCGASFPV